MLPLLLLLLCHVGTNPVQLTRGMDKTVAALVQELKKLSTEVANDKDLANVAAVSAGRMMTRVSCSRVQGWDLGSQGGRMKPYTQNST